jgi:plastocyanin
MNRAPRAALASIAIAAVAAAVPVAVGMSQEAAATATAKQHVVKLRALSFSTKMIAAKPGDTVRFVWVEGVHNVVSTKGPAKVDSGKPAARDRLKITLKKGNYRLICEPHESVGMILAIRVK